MFRQKTLSADQRAPTSLGVEEPISFAEESHEILVSWRF
jgi:hypothetical protein